MPLSLSRNLPGQLMPVGNPLIARLQTDEYVLHPGSPSYVLLTFYQPQLDQGAIAFNVNNEGFTLYIDYQNPPSGNAYEVFWSGYGTAFTPSAFAQQYLQRLSAVPFIYRNFTLSIEQIGGNFFTLRFSTRQAGVPLTASVDVLSWATAAAPVIGTAPAFADNFVISADLYLSYISGEERFIDSLYAFPNRIEDQPTQAEAFLHLDKIIYSTIAKEASLNIEPIFPKLNSDYAPSFNWQTVEPFNHFLRIATLRYWQTFGEPPQDYPIAVESFHAISAGLAVPHLAGFSETTLLRRWLTHRPMVRYATRQEDDFLYFATKRGDSIAVKILLKAYSGSAQQLELEVWNYTQLPDALKRPFQVWQLSANFFRHELADLDMPTPLTHFSIQMLNASDNQPISELYMVVLTDSPPDYAGSPASWILMPPHALYHYRLHFLNSFSTWESLSIEVPLEKSLESKGEELERARSFDNFHREMQAQFSSQKPQSRSIYKASTGYKDDKPNTALALELLNSPLVFLEDGARRIPINIKRETFRVWNDLDFLHEVSFEFYIGHPANLFDKW
jgi:hypothetical protein